MSYLAPQHHTSMLHPNEVSYDNSEALTYHVMNFCDVDNLDCMSIESLFILFEGLTLDDLL